MSCPIRQVKTTSRPWIVISAFASLALGFNGCESKTQWHRLDSSQASAEIDVEDNVRAETPLPPLRLYLDEIEHDTDGDDEPATEFTEEQLQKNFTLLTLSLEPDIRARRLLRFVRDELTLEQEKAAAKLILRQDGEFQKLKRRRAEILEHAFDGQGVDEQLQRIKVETVALSQKLQRQVYKTVLTHEQKAKIVAERSKRQ